jgi:hypothetical protein
MNGATQIAMVLILGLSSGLAQITSGPPAKSWNRRGLGIGLTTRLESVGHNEPSEILKEVTDTNVLHLITSSLRMKERDLKSVMLAPDGKGDAVIYQVWQSVEKPFEKLGGRLRKYVEDREDGHTKDCLLMALTNRYESISDPDLRFMATKEPSIPISSWIEQPQKNLSDGTRAIEFVHVDGKIAWRYLLLCKPDGKYEFPISGPFGEKCDPNEYDPEYGPVIQEIKAQVAAEMKNDGTANQLGSGRRFSALVEERLKKKGIEWRSHYTFRQHRYE